MRYLDTVLEDKEHSTSITLMSGEYLSTQDVTCLEGKQESEVR